MNDMKRDIDVLIISDVHLGTVGCHAPELVEYLDSVRPKKLILNGDFIDIWNFRKFYWPQAHMEVIKRVLSFISEGVQVIYLTGNHDELLRKVAPLQIGNFLLKNKIVLNQGNEKTWIFHGDVFDITMKYSKWLAKMGAVGYDLLILLNRAVNSLLSLFGKRRISLSKRIKQSVKTAINFVEDFETTAIELGIENGYENVICGHIHKPTIRRYTNEKGSIQYLNSGDWIENLTSLEYSNQRWTIFSYRAWKAEQLEETIQKSSNTMELATIETAVA